MPKKSPLDPFIFHGFPNPEDKDTPVRQSGNEVYHDCLFCGKPLKFYINRLTGEFYCQSCRKKGNANSFLGSYFKQHQEQTSKNQLKNLSRLRGIPIDALANVATFHDGRHWIIPIFDHRQVCVDLRVWEEKHGLRSTKGCKLHLFLVDELAQMPSASRVFVCEGEWDATIMKFLLEDAGWEDCCAVGLPGAGTFKTDWVKFFKNKRVVLCLDHDLPGQQGRDRTYKILHKVARTIHVLQWPEALRKGYDVRDFYIDAVSGDQNVDSETILNALMNLIGIDRDLEDSVRPAPSGRVRSEDDQNYREIPFHSIGSLSSKEIPSFKTTLDRYQKYIEMSEDMVTALRIAFAHAFSNQIPGDPLWTYLVGPPGCGKTLLLMSLQGSERCIFQSVVTPHSLVSGFRADPDPSQLPQWNNKCAVLKDFTEMMARHPQARDEIYSTLRGAYDGYVKKPFGNGVVREYWLHFALIAGVTPAIHADQQAMLGERFLKFEMMKAGDWRADQEIRAAIENITHEAEIEVELADAAGRFLSQEVDVKKLPLVPGWLKKRIVALSQLIGALRANVERVAYGEQRMIYRPNREVGTRIAKQLIKLGQMLAFVDGLPEINKDGYQTMVRVAFDSCIGFHLDIIQAIMFEDGAVTRKELSQETRIPETSLGRALEDLHALRILKREDLPSQGAGRPRIAWIVNDLFAELWEESGLSDDPDAEKHVERILKARKGTRVRVRSRRFRKGV